MAQILSNNTDADKHRHDRNKWHQIAENEYRNLLLNKQEKNKQKEIEDQKYHKYIEQRDNEMQMKDNEYKQKFSNINNRIYRNLINHSDYLNTNNIQNAKEPYFLMNDRELNRQIAEQRQQEKILLKKDGTENMNNVSLLEKLKGIEYKEKEQKNEEKKLYKNYLDRQYLDMQNHKNIKDTYVPQDIMPGYKYPSRPIPLYKKAFDSIHLVKNNLLFENQNVGNMKEFFQHDVQNHTLLDQNEQRSHYQPYGTNLVHNPIINPIPSFESNKYLNSLAHSHNIRNSYISENIVERERRDINSSNNIMENHADYPPVSQSVVMQKPLEEVKYYHEEQPITKKPIIKLQKPNILNLSNNENFDKLKPIPHENYDYASNYEPSSQRRTKDENKPTIQNMTNNRNLNNLSKTNKLIQKLKGRIRIRGIQGIFYLKQYLETTDIAKSYLLDYEQFSSFCKNFNLGFSFEDTKELFSYFDDMKIGKIRYEEILGLVIETISEERKSLVVDLYNRLSKVHQNKYVEEQIIKDKFNTRYHPDIISYQKSETDVLTDFINDFNLYFYNTRVS